MAYGLLLNNPSFGAGFAIFIYYMKTDIISTKLALLFTVLAGTLLAFSHSSSAVTIGSAHELGFVRSGILSGDANQLAYVNQLVGMALGADHNANGRHYFRSDNDFSPTTQVRQVDNGFYRGDLGERITVPVPGGGGTQVPDGGATVMLLGAALGALGMVRRYMTS